jgi:hypothetical protein
MTTTELQHDLSAATQDGELFARQQIAGAITYLVEGQRFSAYEVRALVEQILEETAGTDCITVAVTPALASRYVN